MSKKSTKLIFIAVFMLIVSANVRAETFYAYLSSVQEVPPNASTATGYARIVVNESALTISYTIVFNGLQGNQSGAHIHAPAAIGANAGIAIGFPNVGGTSGMITGSAAITATQIAQIRAHQGYVNIHSSAFSGGEIRGQLGIKRPVDFDGDGRQDYSVLKFPATGDPRPITYWNLNSTTGANIGQMWGDAARDLPTPGDYDGDGKDDYAIYRDGTPANPQSEFWILRSADNILQWYSWGLDGDLPVARDYDGDGITDIATYRPAASVGAPAFWYIRQSSNGTARVVHWGTTAVSLSGT